MFIKKKIELAPLNQLFHLGFRKFVSFSESLSCYTQLTVIAICCGDIDRLTKDFVVVLLSIKIGWVGLTTPDIDHIKSAGEQEASHSNCLRDEVGRGTNIEWLFLPSRQRLPFVTLCPVQKTLSSADRQRHKSGTLTFERCFLSTLYTNSDIAESTVDTVSASL